MGVNFAPLTSRVVRAAAPAPEKEGKFYSVAGFFPFVFRPARNGDCTTQEFSVTRKKPSLNHFFLRNNFPLSVPLIRCWLFDSNFREFTVVFYKGKVDSMNRSTQMKH
ncbi:hypothetical protein CEXT_52931 [Caerostris extrusa]|uniref:Uncharacterized protein n=1 Tax=Caerostris extrusa TaxID=172846 RepID=A0AAV4P0M4_CAEEX|nr:hypothetical protein CEXT_52931 [Caerostris extrusa]